MIIVDLFFEFLQFKNNKNAFFEKQQTFFKKKNAKSKFKNRLVNSNLKSKIFANDIEKDNFFLLPTRTFRSPTLV